MKAEHGSLARKATQTKSSCAPLLRCGKNILGYLGMSHYSPMRDVAHLGFDRFREDFEAFGDLLVGIPQADQGGDIFLARCQLIPGLKLFLQELMLF